MTATVIVGANWGDEGKGRIVDYLAVDATASIRFQGGNNAGHTVINDAGTFKLNQLPSGIFNPDCLAVLGPGMVISPEALSLELTRLAAAGISPKLLISDRATLNLPLHAQQDTLEELRLGDEAYGSTRRGIAPAYGDRVMKKAMLVGWLLQPELLQRRLGQWLDWKLPQLRALYPEQRFEHCASELCDYLLRVSAPWRDAIGDTGDTLAAMERAGATLLFEAQLGAARDLVYGEYPWTTSSSVLAAYAGMGSGLPALRPERVIAVAKAFSSSVGTGTLLTAMEQQHDFRQHTGEFGAVTGRPRDIGHFDAVATARGARLQGATEIALTKLDCLSDLGTLKLACAYRHQNTDNPLWPQTQTLQPIYETLPSWSGDITHIRNFAELPPAAQNYVLRIEQLVGLPVTMISVGPERGQMILRQPRRLRTGGLVN